ncbi:MAG TPA: DPP IV N-terminal domain-containing protein [Chitinophagaceae bacterium]|nr:DPP IV N-terminal domain-containing protein [Chitinophagaceae bacterium]HPN58683.1 DPP IV N-terminal domain-containing protein [Chitinophagaceae bacterium]
MKKCLLTLLFLPFYLFSFSQDKILTLEDAMLRARTTLAPENLAQLQFFENSNDYVFLKKQNGQDIWMRGNYKLAGNEWPFLTLPGLNRFMEEAGSDTFKTMPVIRFGTDGWIMNNKGNKIRYNPITKKITLLLSKELAAMENAEESTTGFTAYLDKHNLFVSNPDKQIYQVTTDGSKDIVYASSVHRDEFGISKGIFWSTKGTKLAFYRMDQSMVNDYPIINWSERPARAELIKYPMAGDKSHHVRVGVFNTATESTIWLKTGIPVEQYLTNIAWSPDDKYVFIAVLNREQNHLKLNQYDATTGDFVKTLFEEQDEKYVEPLVPMHFLKNNPGQFIWQSNRDGWNQLYLYDINGKLIRQLTKGNWEVLDVKGFDSKGENLFFVSTILSAVNKNLCSVNLKTGKTNLLTPLPGVHAAQVSVDGSTVLDVYSTIDNPRTIQLIEVKKPAKNPAKLLLQAANPLKEFSAVSLSLFTLKNKKGDSLFCRQFNPVGFSPDKKYPVIVYWYGGPHAQMILNSWNGGAGDYWFRYMAQRGYVVFTVDTRGSDNRGKNFEQSIFRKLGEAQLEDLDAGLSYLKAQSYVDKDRMGLFGWSFGGFLTTDYVLHNPGVFKAAVAGGPVMDWSLYEIMYGERYMDTPQENPEGYASSNLINQAGKLKDKLLLIHGQQDPVVVQQHSVNFVKACVEKGVQVDYMIYPGHEHNVTGRDRVHLYQKVTDYLTSQLR